MGYLTPKWAITDLGFTLAFEVCKMVINTLFV